MLQEPVGKGYSTDFTLLTDWQADIPSVGVKEGLSCVISRAKWHRKARNLALP